MQNSNNVCIFTGRITKDPVLKTKGQGQNTYSTVTFSLAVRRTLTKEQQQAKNQGQPVQDADFIPCSISGKAADTFVKYFPKGKPVQVMGTYSSYQKQDANGNTVFGNIIRVSSFEFVPTDNTQNQGNAGGNNYNQGGQGGYNQGNYNQGGYNQQNGGYGQGNYNQDMYPVDDGDIPF